MVFKVYKTIMDENIRKFVEKIVESENIPDELKEKAREILLTDLKNTITNLWRYSVTHGDDAKDLKKIDTVLTILSDYVWILLQNRI